MFYTLNLKYLNKAGGGGGDKKKKKCQYLLTEKKSWTQGPGLYYPPLWTSPSLYNILLSMWHDLRRMAFTFLGISSID